jgi:epoxyqueuosine reductase
VSVARSVSEAARAAERTGVVREIARHLGFSAVATTTLSPFEADGLALEAWDAAGFAGEMGYMRRGAALLADPRRLAPTARSLLTLAVDHASGTPPPRPPGAGRVARYAWGRDYHDVVRPRLEALVLRVARAEGRTLAARVFTDAVPLLERAAAARAGLGFVGKSTNLLREDAGSRFFLAEILWDLDLPPSGVANAASCGTCRRCLDACPTGAFEGPFRLDARRCISYWTIEARGPIPRDLRPRLGEWVFGCDVCQDVCPFDRFPRRDAWPELRAEAGVGPHLGLVETLSIEDDAAFRDRFAGTALLRPRRAGLLRNAAVVAGNVGCVDATDVLERRARTDSAPLVRGHALWALARLAPSRGRAAAAALARDDPDSFVREEAASVLEPRTPTPAPPAGQARG